jgi:hypothetical protein
MKLPLNNIVKLYSVSNIIFYKISDSITQNNIIDYTYDNIKEIILCHKFDICNVLPFFILYMYYNILPNYKINLKKSYIKKIKIFDNNKNITKIIDFICTTILIIFIKNIENAI